MIAMWRLGLQAPLVTHNNYYCKIITVQNCIRSFSSFLVVVQIDTGYIYTSRMCVSNTEIRIYCGLLRLPTVITVFSDNCAKQFFLICRHFRFPSFDIYRPTLLVHLKIFSLVTMFLGRTHSEA